MTIEPTFIVTAYCSNEYFDDCPTYATISINEEGYKYIKKAQRTIKKLGACTIESFDAPLEWNHLKDLDSCKANEELTLDDLEEHDMSTECDILKVTEISVYYTSDIKHCDNTEVYTDSLSIKLIDKCFKVLKMPLEDMPTYIHDEEPSIRLIATERLKHGA